MTTPIGCAPTTLLAYDTGNGTVQVISIGSPLPTTATLSGNVTIGDLALANAANPSLSEDGEYPLSVDLSGHLRVLDSAVVTAIGNGTVTLGQTTMSASVPVTLASDQSALAVSVSSGNVTVANIGQAAMAASIPVVIASNQSAIAVTPENGNVTVINGVTNPVFTEESFLFSNIKTNTTTVVKSGAGILHSIVVNTLGLVASSVIIYDNTAGSGTTIGTINTLTLSGSFIYDLAFATGLTIVTTGGVDITVTYR